MKTYISEKIRLAARYSRTHEGRVDFYLIIPGSRNIYAFSGNYRKTVYDMFKNGISVNAVMQMKSKDSSVMRIVSQCKRMVPYLTQEFDIPTAKGRRYGIDAWSRDAA